MTLEIPATLRVYYDDSKDRPVRFEGVLDITEGADGSLKIVYDGQIVKILGTYRYYILDLNGEDDGEG